MEGLDWAVAHPEEAVAIYVERHPELEARSAAGAVEGGDPVDGVAAGERRAGLQDVAELASAAATGWSRPASSSRAWTCTAAVTNDYLPEQ